LITSNSTNENEVYVGGFTSEDESKIILQVFNEGEEKDFSMDIPIGAISVEKILTTNNDSEEFISMGLEEINYYDRYFTTTLPELSLTSFVFNIDESLSNSSNYLANNNLLEVRLFPNPSEDEISLIFTDYSTYSLNIFDLKGQKIMQKTIFDNEASIDISEFQKGTYLLKISSMSDEKTITKKIIKQ